MDDAAVREVARGGEVRERADAARWLALNGGFDDLGPLFSMAIDDSSPAVRLHAASSAVDLCLRLRWRGDGWGPAVEASIRQRLAEAPLVTRPGLIAAYAAIADDAAIDELSGLLRDRRAEVRQGAAWAVRRLALSAHGQSHPKLIGAVRRWVVGRRLPPDALAEVVGVLGDCGWPGFDGVLGAVAGPALAAVVARARAGQAELADAVGWFGLWVEIGRDVLGVGVPTLGGWVSIAGDAWRESGQRRRFRLHDGEGHRADGRVRRVRESREPPRAAIQFDGRTAWRVDSAPATLASATDTDIQEWVSGWWDASGAQLSR